MYNLIVVLRSSLKLVQGSDTSAENGITFPDPVKNPNAFPATINIPIVFISSIPLISFWTRTVYLTWFQQLLCQSTILMIHTLCSIRTLNQQLNNLEQTHFRCSLHCERWTVKRRDCASALPSFKEITYRTEEWTKQLLRLKSWVISGSLEQWMEFHVCDELWLSLSVAICFSCLNFIVCWCIIFFKIFFLFPFVDNFEWEVKINRQLLCKVTLLWAVEAATYLSTLQKVTLA